MRWKNVTQREQLQIFGVWLHVIGEGARWRAALTLVVNISISIKFGNRKKFRRELCGVCVPKTK